MKVDNMDVNDRVKATGLRRKATLNVSFCVNKERNASFKKVSRILQKSESDRTEEDKEVLNSCSDVVKEVTSRLEKRNKLKARSEEVEDSQEVLEAKCNVLAQALQQARHLVVYSGAGVSTAACIPDYRGSNGIWTRLQQGLDIGQHDLSNTQPTLTHMVLYSLYRRGMLKHVVSQNCDGLHLRSGLPRAALSEVHGNMYLEVCQPCKLEYWRLFDVTEHTGRYSHATARRCYACHKPLRDTIVHFGERGALKWPLNWSGATAAANQADVILCIGSSLKVLKKYPWLWGMDRPAKKRPSLYIVNLQWTPKDDHAALKINGKCDDVMRLVMSKLGMPIPEYNALQDPIFVHATRLHSVETHTYSTAALDPPDEPGGANNKRAGEPNVEQESNKRLCVDTTLGDGITIKTEPTAGKKTPEEEEKSVSELAEISEVEKEIVEGRAKSPLEKEELKNFGAETSVEEQNHVDDRVKPTVNEEKTNLENNECANHIKTEVCSDAETGVVTEQPIISDGMNSQDEVKRKEDGLKSCEPNISSSFKVKEEVISENATLEIKVEVDSGSSSCLKTCDEKSADSSKSPKGIWRPFAFDSSESSSSTSCVSSNVAKTKLSSHWNSDLKLLESPLKKSISLDNSIVKSKSLHLDQNNLKKCHIQLEPLDLSCAKKLEPEKDNPFFCKYCRVHYHSMFCLFYRRHHSETPPDPPCYCCDEEDEKDPSSPDADTKSADDSDKSTTKVPITNPGWFGKGYRKKIRKKR